MESMFEDLSLSKDEDEELVLDIGEEQQQLNHLERCLVGHFLTDRTINFNVMRNRMANSLGKVFVLGRSIPNYLHFSFFTLLV